jgi:hypothetical protein
MLKEAVSAPGCNRKRAGEGECLANFTAVHVTIFSGGSSNLVFIFC